MNGAQNEHEKALQGDTTMNEKQQQDQQYQTDGTNPGYSQGQQWQEEPRRSGPVPRRKDLPYKSAALATILSMMPGMGQVYVGHYRLGFQYVAVFALTITVLTMGVSGLEPLFGIFLAFFCLYNLIDAHRRATMYNRALDGLAAEGKIEDISLPGAQGSIPAGIALVVIGLLIFMDLNLGISLEWLEDAWPLGLVLMGGWLIYKGRKGD